MTGTHLLGLLEVKLDGLDPVPRVQEHPVLLLRHLSGLVADLLANHLQPPEPLLAGPKDPAPLGGAGSGGGLRWPQPLRRVHVGQPPLQPAGHLPEEGQQLDQKRHQRARNGPHAHLPPFLLGLDPAFGSRSFESENQS